MSRLYQRDDLLHQRLKDDRHLLHQAERMQRHNHLGYGAMGYSYGGVGRTPSLRTPHLGGVRDPLMGGMGMQRRRMSMVDGMTDRGYGLDPSLAIREVRMQQQTADLINRERRLSQERDILRMHQLEEQAYLQSRATVHNYGLSPRLGAFDAPYLDPYQSAYGSPYARTMSPYMGGASYPGTGLLDADPFALNRASPHMHDLAYLDVPTHTPGRIGLPLGTPRMVMIDPPLF